MDRGTPYGFCKATHGCVLCRSVLSPEAGVSKAAWLAQWCEKHGWPFQLRSAVRQISAGKKAGTRCVSGGGP